LIGRGLLAGNLFFNGDIDEVRISRTSRPAGYAAAHHRSTTDTFLTYGPELPHP
jgi:hypothetical protein